MQFYSLIGQSKIMYISYLLYAGHLMMLSSTQAHTSMSLSDQMVSQHALTCVGIELGKGSPLVNVPMYGLYASVSLMYICTRMIMQAQGSPALYVPCALGWVAHLGCWEEPKT